MTFTFVLRILLLLLTLSALFCKAAIFSESEYTRITAILTEILYSSINEPGESCLHQIEFSLNLFIDTYAFSQPLLKNITILSCTQTTSLFINLYKKELFFGVRSPKLISQSLKENHQQSSQLLYFQELPNKFTEINQLINNEVVEHANNGFEIIFFGHSLGGTVALLACIETTWMNHCEIHNPYLDALLINKLNVLLYTSNTGKKILIQLTTGDLMSQLPQQLKLNSLQSSIPNLFHKEKSNLQLLAHSSITLFAQLFLNPSQLEALISNMIQTLPNEENLLKIREQSKDIFSQIISAARFQSKYTESIWDSRKSQTCPEFHSCFKVMFGPKKCLPGFISIESACTFCNPGTYSLKIGSEYCNECPLGYYCHENNQPPIPAPPGSYQPLLNNTSYFYCVPGMYNTKFAQTECLSCPVGHYCPNKDQNPIPCPPGYYQPNVNKTSCLKCGEGMYSARSGQQICDSCPIGSYCPFQDQNPKPCPPSKCCERENSTTFFECSHSTNRFLELKLASNII